MPKLDIKEIAKPALALVLICAVVAGALAAVNAFTLEPIRAGEQTMAREAMREIFPEDGAEFTKKNGWFAVTDAQGAPLGACIESEGQGYGSSPIRVMVGLEPDGRVRKIQILAADDETPGVGQKVRGEDFIAQFVGRGGRVVLNGDVDALTGATFSSRGVAQAVNRALELYETQIKGRMGGARG